MSFFKIRIKKTQIISDIRLRGGNYSGEGRLEVQYHDSWGTVCDDSFSDKSANVACRQLGYYSYVVHNFQLLSTDDNIFLSNYCKLYRTNLQAIELIGT